MFARRMRLAYLRLFSQPSKARVRRMLREDGQRALGGLKFYEGESGHGRFR